MDERLTELRHHKLLRDRAYTELGHQLKRVEGTLLRLDLGTSAGVRIDDKTILMWCKHQRHWGLFLQHDANLAELTPLGNGSRGHRLLAVQHLDALLEVLLKTQVEATSAIEDAIQEAIDFVARIETALESTPDHE